MVARADALMYSAKKAGKDNVRFVGFQRIEGNAPEGFGPVFIPIRKSLLRRGFLRWFVLG